MFKMPFCLTLGEEGGPGLRSVRRQRDRSSYLSKEQTHVPVEGILLRLNSLRTEARSSFQNQKPIPWPGALAARGEKIRLLRRDKPC